MKQYKIIFEDGRIEFHTGNNKNEAKEKAIAYAIKCKRNFNIVSIEQTKALFI